VAADPAWAGRFGPRVEREDFSQECEHMKNRILIVAGVLVCWGGMAGCAWASEEQPAAGNPPSAITPVAGSPRQPNPGDDKTVKPGGEKPPEETEVLGPNGTKHKFPLKVYDETADGYRTIGEALVKAKAENKRVLAMWGENMCQFCLFLEDILANDPGCSPVVKGDYVWVRIDFGREFSKGIIKHKDLADSYGVTQLQQRPDGKTMGAPALCIIDPETGKTVGEWDAARACPQGVMGGNDMVAKPMMLNRLFDEKVIEKFLITWRPPAKPAAGAMGEATAAAKRDGKKILALFTMPNDEACDRASGWFMRGDAASAIGNAFVPVRIDIERMIGGREMLREASGKPVLPPFICVLDESGKPIGGEATRFNSLPKTDAEIEAFIKGLSGAAKIGEADKAVLVRSLKDAAGASASPKKP
jgi:hypothetical protein